MSNRTESIEVLFGSLSNESKDMVMEFTKTLATGEANARKAIAESMGKEQCQNATAR